MLYYNVFGMVLIFLVQSKSISKHMQEPLDSALFFF